MSKHNWICKNCGEYFNPLKPDGEFSFNCPHCQSNLTAPTTNNTEKNIPDDEKK